ncbi:hypothetical protein Syun_019113 [Stephania yunnanensis]|uniref:Uncharacterized protein n=1 Tax=Stephania yunnanensis TaxID=152371 RepID=A0AAP0NZ36_9MAGN
MISLLVTLKYRLKLFKVFNLFVLASDCVSSFFFVIVWSLMMYLSHSLEDQSSIEDPNLNVLGTRC